MSWRIVNTVADRIAVGWFALTGVAVRDASPALAEEIDARTRALRSLFPDPSAASDLLQAGRRLYHGLGIDPSRRRPSSEALLRRVLQGKGLYTVNTAVDAGNLTSLTHFRSIGLYDLDRVRPEAGEGEARVVLRLGRPGESYPGIRKDEIHLTDRPALVDTEGPFGNPSSDSERTAVSGETRRILYVIYEPPGESAEAILHRLSSALDILQRHLGGTLETPPTL